jgi:hypothetical protein
MKYNRFACVTLGLLLFAVALRTASRAGGLLEVGEGNFTSLSGVGSPRELAVRIGKLLSSSSTSDLDRVVTDPDSTVALAAGWERVCRTLPKADRDEAISPDKQAISRFLGLLEGRARCPIPKAWEASVKSAKGRSQGRISFTRPKLQDGLLKGQRTLERVGELWTVKMDGQFIKLPAADGLGIVNCAAVELAGEKAFVALYGWPPTPYRLFAVDRASGKVLWSSKAWAAGNWLHYSGQGWHDVFVRFAGETLTVFGTAGSTVYVEAFDNMTGECRWRYSTAYFDESSPRE